MTDGAEHHLEKKLSPQERWGVLWIVLRVFLVVSFAGYVGISQYQIEQIGAQNHQIVQSLTCNQAASEKLTTLPPLCKSLAIAEGLATFVASVQKSESKPNPQVTQIVNDLGALCTAAGLQPNCKPKP
jgi:flagellar basal body-associated protein FliL